ncbi:MAG: 6,7-dimethyl-8-ribityllumazine synthase [Pyrinomonadaceae bacterium]
MSFAIVVSRWNDAFTSKLESGAVEALKSSGVGDESIDVFHVPGAFELPLACLTAAGTNLYDAVIALGVVIRGDTPHFDYVAGQAAAGLMQASMQTEVPVMFGVITADNIEQVETRSGEKADNKGWEAAVSAVEMANTMREIALRRERDIEF